MKHGRVDVAERNTCKTAHKCDEFVEVLGTDSADERAEQDQQDTQPILLPLDLGVHLAAAMLEDAAFENLSCGSCQTGVHAEQRLGIPAGKSCSGSDKSTARP